MANPFQIAQSSTTATGGTIPPNILEAQQKRQDVFKQLLDMEDQGQLSPNKALVIQELRNRGAFPPPLSGASFGTRVKLGFLQGGQQQLDYLTKTYGQGNARYNPKIEGYEFKDSKTGIFKPINESSISLGDVGAMVADIPGTAGAIAGSLTPAPITGSGLGYAAGEAIKRGIGQMIQPDTTFTQPEFAKEALTNLFFGSAMEAVPQGVTKLWGKFKAPFANEVDQQVLRTANELGIKMTPSEIINEHGTLPFILRAMERVSESTPIGSVPFKKLKADRAQMFINLGKNKADKLLGEAKSPTEIQTAINDAITGGENTFRQVSNTLYGNVDQIAKTLPSQTINVGTGPSSFLDVFGNPIEKQMTKEVPRAVLTNDVKQFALDALKKIPEQERVAAGKGGTEASALVSQLERIAQLDNQVKFEDAQFYKSQLLMTVRADKTPLGGQVKGTASKLAGLFDKGMKDAAVDHPELKIALEKANEYYTQGKILFNDQFISSLADAKPEQITKSVYSSVSNIRKLKAATSPDTFVKVQRARIEDLISSGIKVQEGGDEYFAGQAVLSKWNSIPNEIKQEGFSPEVRDFMNRYLVLASKAPSRDKGIGLWGMSQGVRGLGAALGAGGIAFGVSGGNTATGLTAAGTVLLAPYAFGKLVTSELGRKWLTEGFKVSPKTERAVSLIAKLPALLRGGQEPQNKEPIHQRDIYQTRK